MVDNGLGKPAHASADSLSFHTPKNLWALVGATHTEPQALAARLKAQGITANSEQSIGKLARRHGVGKNRLLAMVFLPQ